jgi:hypothetical protein
MAKLAGNFDLITFTESAFKQGPRAAEAGPGELERQASMAQLTAAFDSGKLVELSPPFYWAGWEWSSNFLWSAAKGGAEGKTLGMFTTVNTPALLGLPDLLKTVGVTADVRGTMASTSNQLQRLMFSSVGFGSSDMKLVPAVPTAAAVATALGPHLQGTQLPLTITLSNVL